MLLQCCRIKFIQIKKSLSVICFSYSMILLMYALSGTFEKGMIVVFQLLFVAFTSYFFVQTTNELDLIHSIEVFLKPLKIFGFKSDRYAIFLALTLRFIPMISFQYQQIHYAQKAKGLEKNIVAIIIPLLIKVFRAADTITEALIARGGDIN